MASPLRLQRSRSYPVPVERAFEFTLPAPLEEIFSRRYGPLPPIVRTEQDGVWGAVGQSRTIHTSDGGSVVERLTSVDAPREFRYELGEIDGPLRFLASRVEGAWSFSPAGTGCRITWAWTVHPASGSAGLAMPVFARVWRGYARQALERIEDLTVE
jgi:Polyketide cyclase / dehydrase and lipid transport